MRFDLITIFPEWFESPLKTGLLGKAIESGLIQVAAHDLRNWGLGRHRKVDDEPFGGGAGMVMAPGPLVEAVEAVSKADARVILLVAAGRPLDQQMVGELARSEQIVLVCGRYEGIDERVAQAVDADEVSIGEFVLAGGEVAALAVVEAVSRLIPGLMGNRLSLDEESFSSGLLEYPQFTRPAEFRGLRVPDVLMSGDHARVAGWRRRQAIRRTFERRPHLLDRAVLSDEETDLVRQWRREVSPGQK